MQPLTPSGAAVPARERFASAESPRLNRPELFLVPKDPPPPDDFRASCYGEMVAETKRQRWVLALVPCSHAGESKTTSFFT